MNAIQFIKENGVDKAREVVEGAPDGATYYVNEKSKIVVGLHGFYADGFCVGIHNPHTHIKISELKRLVKSIDLVEFEGGLDKAKNVLFLKRALGLTPHADRLEQAIADYEQIFGGEHV